jgi:hypothetical protein
MFLKWPAWLVALAALFASVVAGFIFVWPGDGMDTPWGYVGKPSRNLGKVIAGQWNGIEIENQSYGSLASR